MESLSQISSLIYRNEWFMVNLIVNKRITHEEDSHRPRYHYLPAFNWMNDPNGVIQWNGRYHLFYQYNPDGAYHANMHWGHAVSDNMIHWEELPIALAPTPNTVDEGGIFSGCIVDNNGTPTAFYTGVNPDYSIQTQCMAIGSPDLMSWEKYSENPVIGDVPPDIGTIKEFRDPYVWKQDDLWLMVVGTLKEDFGGAVLLYRSQNLVDWEYLNPLFTSNNRQFGLIWECPNFFKLGDKWVLIISAHTGKTTDTVFYFVGDFQNNRFIPSYSNVLDYGNLYAPLTFEDNQNRRLMYGWMRESRSEVDQRQSGWSGVQAIPRVLTLDDQDRLITTPVPELETVRGNHHHYDNIQLTGSIELDVEGFALDIEAEFLVDENGTCGFTLALSPTSRDKTQIIYDAHDQRLTLHKIFPETNTAINTHSREIPHILEDQEFLQLRILLDGSVLEIIANGRTSLTSRIYPTDSNSQKVNVFGSEATLQKLDIWEMSSIW